MVIPSIPTVADSLGSIRISIGASSGGGGGGGGGSSAGFAAYTFDFSNEASYNQAAGTFLAKSGTRYVEVTNAKGTAAKTGVAYATLCPTHSGLGAPAILINASTTGLGLTRATNPFVAELASPSINANGGGYYVVAAGLVSRWDGVTGADGWFFFFWNSAQTGGPNIGFRLQNYASDNVQGEIFGYDPTQRFYFTADIPIGAIERETATLPPAYRMRVAIKHIYGTATEFKVRTDTIDVTENTSATLNGCATTPSSAKTFTGLIRGNYSSHLTYRVKNLCVVPFAPGGDNAAAYAQAIADADSSLWFL